MNEVIRGEWIAGEKVAHKWLVRRRPPLIRTSLSSFNPTSITQSRGLPQIAVKILERAEENVRLGGVGGAPYAGK